MWYVMLCQVVNSYQHFKGSLCLQDCFTLKVKAIETLKISANAHPATWHHIPEDLNILKCCCENIKSVELQWQRWQKQSFRTHFNGTSSFYALWFWLTWGCDFPPFYVPWVKWLKGHVHVRVTLLAMDCEHNTLSGTNSQLMIAKHK